MPRPQQRGIALLGFFALSGFLVYLGFEGWTLNGILPLEYVGYFFTGVAVLGLCGVNIWANGPLDPNLDPKPDDGDKYDSSRS